MYNSARDCVQCHDLIGIRAVWYPQSFCHHHRHSFARVALLSHDTKVTDDLTRQKKKREKKQVHQLFS